MLFRRKKASAVLSVPDGAVRMRLRWEGDVQAVGFRFSARQIASGAGVTGWVRNLDDGTVQAEVQGSPVQISDFERGVGELSASPRSWINARLVEKTQIPPIPEKAFRII